MRSVDMRVRRWARSGMRLGGWFLLVGLLSITVAQGQGIGEEDEEGAPYHVEQFTPEEYDAHRQNWAFAQDTSGLLYVGNNNGILVYDGSSWTTIPTPQDMPARSLARAPDGRIYVGSVGDFGYVAADSLGRLKYVSIANGSSVRPDTSADIWTTNVTSDGVYFQSHRRLYRWSDGAMKTWEPTEQFYKAFGVRNSIYVHDPGVGLMRLTDDSLELLPGGETFRGEKVSVVLSDPDGGLLIGTMAGELYRYREGAVNRFFTSADDFLSETRVYDGCVIPDGSIALATLGKGVVIVDQNGRLRRVLNTKNGLLNNIVGYVYPDHRNGLWMAMDRGLARVEVPPALSVIDKRGGLEGTVVEVARHEDTLYAATTYNLFRKTAPCLSSSGNVCFEPVFEESRMSWSLLSVDSGLLIARGGGVFWTDGEEVRSVVEDEVSTLYRSRLNENRVYAGTKEGLRTIDRREGRWVPGDYHPEIERDVRSIVEDSTGILWLGTHDQKVYRLTGLEDSFATAAVQQFSSGDGLPSGVVYMVSIAHHPAFVTREGVYRFQPARAANASTEPKQLFHPDSAITAAFDDWSMDLLKVVEDAEGRAWFVFEQEVRVLHHGSDGKYRRLPPPAFRFGGNRIHDVYSDGQMVWFGSEEGLIRYDQRRLTGLSQGVSAQIRRVTINGDSLLSAGQRSEAKPPPALSYNDNNLRFTYTAPLFDDRETTSYQYYLEGFSDGWSRWTKETRRTYTNLPEGEYTFSVRARDTYGYVTQVGQFNFSVLPPWYRTWWAYALYGVAFIGILAGYGQIRASAKSRKLERQRLITEQLKEANNRLEEANRLKDEFLTTISHEFRTPLASMAGFASILEQEVDEDKRHFARYIQESGSRLQERLNSVLDLAKLRAGKVEVNPESIDLVSKTASIVQLFQPLAQEKDLALEVDLPDHEVIARVDAFSFERILNNLISNAIKFTESGSVTVHLRASRRKVRVEVRDTGIGIEDEFQSRLFDEFRQESSGLSRTHEGVGLGLAITRHLVELMDGEVDVESTKGEGSVFTVTFRRSQEQEMAQ